MAIHSCQLKAIVWAKAHSNHNFKIRHINVTVKNNPSNLLYTITNGLFFALAFLQTSPLGFCPKPHPLFCLDTKKKAKKFKKIPSFSPQDSRLPAGFSPNPP
jgi:hypothetical protein